MVISGSNKDPDRTLLGGCRAFFDGSQRWREVVAMRRRWCHSVKNRIEGIH
jgi:hypothetical protein